MEAYICKQIEEDGEVNLIQKGANDATMEYICTLNTKKIRHLNLGHNQIRTKGMTHFSKVHWDNLVLLNLWGNSVQDRGCKFIAQVRLGKLQQLYLSKNSIGSTGVSHLSKGDWPNLEVLKLSWNHIGVDGFSYITKGNWGKLKEVRLNWNKLTVQQVVKIMSCQRSMKSLFLPYNSIALPSKQSLKNRLQAKFVEAEITL